MKTCTVRLSVTLTPKAGSEEQLARLFLSEFIPRSRTESGCRQYELWRSEEGAALFNVVEVWESQDDLDRHLAQDWFRECGPRLMSLLAAPPQMAKFSSAEER